MPSKAIACVVSSTERNFRGEQSDMLRWDTKNEPEPPSEQNQQHHSTFSNLEEGKVLVLVDLHSKNWVPRGLSEAAQTHLGIKEVHHRLLHRRDWTEVNGISHWRTDDKMQHQLRELVSHVRTSVIPNGMLPTYSRRACRVIWLPTTGTGVGVTASPSGVIVGRRAVAGICPAAGEWRRRRGGRKENLWLESHIVWCLSGGNNRYVAASFSTVWNDDDMFHIVTLHCFVLHGSDVLKTWRRNIPVFLHLLLLLTVRRAAVSNKKKVFSWKSKKKPHNKLVNTFISFWVIDLINQSYDCQRGIRNNITAINPITDTVAMEKVGHCGKVVATHKHCYYCTNLLALVCCITFQHCPAGNWLASWNDIGRVSHFSHMSHDIDQHFHTTIKRQHFWDQRRKHKSIKHKTKVQSSASDIQQFQNTNDEWVLGFNITDIPPTTITVQYTLRQVRATWY